MFTAWRTTVALLTGWPSRIRYSRSFCADEHWVPGPASLEHSPESEVDSKTSPLTTFLTRDGNSCSSWYSFTRIAVDKTAPQNSDYRHHRLERKVSELKLLHLMKSKKPGRKPWKTLRTPGCKNQVVQQVNSMYLFQVRAIADTQARYVQRQTLQS